MLVKKYIKKDDEIKMAYDEIYRVRALAYKKNGHTFKELYEAFKITARAYYQWVELEQSTGGLAYSASPGRPREISREALRQAVEAQPDLYLRAYAAALGCSVSAVDQIFKEEQMTLNFNDVKCASETITSSFVQHDQSIIITGSCLVSRCGAGSYNSVSNDAKTIGEMAVGFGGSVTLYGRTVVSAWSAVASWRGTLTLDTSFIGSLPPFTTGYQMPTIFDYRTSKANSTFPLAHKGRSTLPAEYKTGDFWGGRPVYMQEFSGSVTVVALVPTQINNLATGLAEIYASGGMYVTMNGVKYALECQAIASAKTLSNGAIMGYYGYDLAIGSGGALNLRLCSIDAGTMNYHIWVKYTKTADTPV
jgi:transposase